MAELDAEILDRAVRWCAKAGREVTAAEVRRALAPLSWDELLAVKALLADPPPERPLGPHALADMARGAPPDVAAEREREGRYRTAGEVAEDVAGAPPRRSQPVSSPPGSRRHSPLIRRARDRKAAASPPTTAPKSLDDLRRPEGRAVLERLLRRLGARRRAIAAELASGWVLPDGSPPGEADLSALLAHHGLLRAFEHRERDELLHALRAARGVRAVAAERLSLDLAGLDAALERLGARDAALRIREERRSELRSRATLAERVRLLLGDESSLADLDLLDEFERDVGARLPEHVKALRAGTEPLESALCRSLSLSRTAAETLAARFSLDLRGRTALAGPPRARKERPPGPARGRPPAPGARTPRRSGSRGVTDPRGGRPRGPRGRRR